MQDAKGCPQTRLALLWMQLSSEPMVALYTLLPFILRKDLGAPLWEVSLFLTLRPVLSVLSFYWSSRLTIRKDHPLTYLITTWVLAYLPFLLVPFSDSYWMLFIAAGTYQLFSRAVAPASLEILRRNVPKAPREHYFSLYYMLSFVESGLFALTIGRILDSDSSQWRWVCALAALLALTSVAFQRKVVVPRDKGDTPPPRQPQEPLLGRGWLRPWKESFALLRARPDFAHFQWSFMIGGTALMLMTPALAVFYADSLQISHTELSMARFVFMACGVVLSSWLWKQGLQLQRIWRFMSLVLVGFALFPLLLLGAFWHLNWLYAGFLVYGIAQAGSHLIWNLSGTVFTHRNTAPFTAVNLCTVGIRGIIAPLLGGLLCDQLGAVPVLLLGSALAALGSWYVLYRRVPMSVPQEA